MSEQSSEQKRLPDRAIRGLRVLPWIAAALLALLAITWAFKHLLPHQEPILQQESTSTATFPAASPTPKPPSTRNAILYTVNAGDTLARIIEESGVPLEIFVALNNLNSNEELLPGTELILGYSSATPTQREQGSNTLVPLTTGSSSEEIRRCLQFSAGTWNTLWVDALITTSAKGVLHVEREQVWLNSESSRWITGVHGEKPSLLWLANEGNSALIDLESGEIQELEIAGRIPSQLENLLLPAHVAARGGEFQPLNQETIIGMGSLVVNWIDNENHLSDKYWIDLEHCVILKWLHLSREYAAASGEILPEEIAVTAIVINEDFDDSLFDAQGPFPDDFWQTHLAP